MNRFEAILKTIFPLFVLLNLTACKDSINQNYKRELFVFGTTVQINVIAPVSAQTQVETAANEISDTFNAMHHQWHAWKPGRLSDINGALQAGQSIQLTVEEASFITQTIELSKQSDHHFNPAMGALINLWGFHADEYPILTPPPTTAQIKQLTQQNITVDDLILNELTLSSENPDIWLDLGGIAKGYAIDVAADILLKHGLSHAIINAGGDLRSLGYKGDFDKPWRIAIQSPQDWSMVAEITIDKDESVFTSGNYQRYKEFNGQRYAHIIDSRTGMPVKDIVSATVIAESGVLADAAATALVVAGKDWLQVAQNMRITQALIINNQMQCQGTKAILARLEKLKLVCTAVD